MEKKIIVGDYEFAAKSTAASLLSYKRHFGRDGLVDMLNLVNSIADTPAEDAEEGAESVQFASTFDFDTFFRFMWVFARAANPTIPGLEEWMEGFDIGPIDFAIEALDQTMDLLFDSTKTAVKPKNRPAAAARTRK